MNTPDRWQRVEALYHAARERDVEERAAFLDVACKGDVTLRREIEALLAQSTSTGDFLSEPAMATAWPRACSGLMCAGVPRMTPACVPPTVTVGDCVRSGVNRPPGRFVVLLNWPLTSH